VPVPFKAKAVKKRKPIRITIPKQIVDYLKIKESDSLEITVQNIEIIVQKEKKE
jgi:bifunctional DNA-binding transcriptional regulator/antitoxin component of YhaV-PrlF toxin-antitoxin module